MSIGRLGVKASTIRQRVRAATPLFAGNGRNSLMHRVTAGFLMTMGLIAATVALVAFSISHTLLERDRVQAASAEILKAAPVQSLLADKIADDVTGTLPAGPAIAFAPSARIAAKSA